MLILVLISLSKQNTTLRASCLIFVVDATFLVIFFFLRVECLHDMFSLLLYTNYTQNNSIIGVLHKSLAWFAIPSEENWVQLFQPCCCTSLCVFCVFKWILHFIFLQRKYKKIKGVLEDGINAYFINILIARR